MLSPQRGHNCKHQPRTVVTRTDCLIELYLQLLLFCHVTQEAQHKHCGPCLHGASAVSISSSISSWNRVGQDTCHPACSETETCVLPGPCICWCFALLEAVCICGHAEPLRLCRAEQAARCQLQHACSHKAVPWPHFVPAQAAMLPNVCCAAHDFLCQATAVPLISFVPAYCNPALKC